MKKVILYILSVFVLAGAPVLRAENIGVPSECEDVMLQAFYWDSYKTQTSTDSKYGRTRWLDLIADTAAINANFDLVWFPPSAKAGGVGYTPKQYSNQDSDWGTAQKLSQLIAALHAGKTKVIADIVINHRGNLSNWCNFFQDNFGAYGTYQLTQQHICRNDEGFTDPKSSCYNAATSERGANDTGSNFDGARDLDHTSEYVQEWAKAYVRWIMGEMRYDGFRYDMTLGFHGRYLSMYNEAANPYMSVSELWESIDRQKRHLTEANYNTMVFDFPTKFSLNQAFASDSYGKLNKNKTLNGLRKEGLEKYAVTFLDNHDTFERGNAYGDNQFGGEKCDLNSATIKNKVLQASAYLLMMPGVPCVFWPHWVRYKDEINALIAVRKRAGIHSESAVLEESSAQYQYNATVQGHRGTVIVRVGKNRSTDVPEGYELAVEGGSNGYYSVFIKMGAEGLEDVRNQHSDVRKVMRDGKIYVLRGDKTYDVLGNEIK